MRCEDLRDRLPELALGTLPAAEARPIREHLSWCAGCRKEVQELEEGAEVLGLASGPADPPPHLEERVVGAVVRASGSARRRRGPALVAAVAALLALLAIGWGAAMAGRVTTLDNEAQTARRAAADATRQFGALLDDVSGGGVREADLRARTAFPGGGRAILYDSDVAGASDWVLVVVGGLPEDRGPYRAMLRGDGTTLRIGRLWPSAEGRLATYALYGALPADSTSVVVLDRNESVVLEGRLVEG